MIVLNGKVIDSRIKTSGGSKPIPSAKVFISDEYGEITPKKIGAISDENGNYTLSLPSTIAAGMPIPLIDGKYITMNAPSLTEGRKKTITIPLEGKNRYDFDLAVLGLSATLDEVSIKAKRIPSKSTKSNSEPWKYFLIGGSLILVAVVGFTLYKNIKK